MNETSERPYGLWPSPLSPKNMSSNTRLNDLAWDSDGEMLVWLEGRGDLGVLVCVSLNGDAPRDLTTEISVRARVGYGGGDFGVAHGQVYFADAGSGRLYRQALADGAARPITPPFGQAAAPAISPDGRWVVYVHSLERTDRLAIVDAEGQSWPQQFVSGSDFYMQPRWSPDGSRLAWIEWDHPNMPWDGTRLRLGTVQTHATGLPTIGDITTVAGGPDIAVFQAEFSPDGRSLAYLSDETGWSNLFQYDIASDEQRMLTQEQADLGQPAWSQGMRAYAFSADGASLLFLRNEGGFRQLWRYDLATATAVPLDALADYTWVVQPAISSQGHLAAIVSASTIPTRLVTADLNGQTRIVARSSGENVPASELSTPRPVSWSVESGATVHGLYYPPASGQYRGSGLPPAIVQIHGGPTGQSTTMYSANIQFFTTRGYAVLDVNYRGSTGYGREYMLALRDNWGVTDVEDAVGAAHYLASKGLADGNRLVILGGSAGGYTIWQTLVQRPGVFKAAVCMYGVTNLFTLAADTHKFEERYLDTMIGPLPETANRYRERSPIFFADRIADPVAVFQGDIDQVVPRAQSDLIVAALRHNNVPHEYHVYEGEGHGWRKRETIEQFWGAVERFLKEHVLFG